MKWADCGQSVVEYTMIVAMLIVVLYFMGTSVKRGVQSVIKVTADQVGSQQNSDQEFNDIQQGYLVGSNTQVASNAAKEAAEIGYIAKTGETVYLQNTIYNESTYEQANSITNAGFTPSN